MRGNEYATALDGVYEILEVNGDSCTYNWYSRLTDDYKGKIDMRLQECGIDTSGYVTIHRGETEDELYVQRIHDYGAKKNDYYADIGMMRGDFL